MKTLRFLHLSDLHLDSNLNLFSYERQEQFEMQHAPYLALKNFIDLCKSHKPDFVIFSGNMYNSEEGSLKARFTLKNAFEELSLLNIPVYYALGNLDFISEKTKQDFSSIVWPDNIYIFDETWNYFSYFYNDDKTGQPKELARIFGISHSCKNEIRNLVSLFQPDYGDGINIGVLHTSMSNYLEKNKGLDDFAPCSEKDLTDKSMDYWALGHFNNFTEINKDPLIIFPGAVQGLNINDIGQHGCVMVEITCNENAEILKPKYTFFSLAPLEWHSLDVKLPSRQEVDNITKVQKIISKAIGDYVQKLSFSPHCTDLAFRIRLYGNSDVSDQLKDLEIKHELCKLLEKNNSEPRIYIKDIVSHVRPVFAFNEAIERDDILGEVFRVTNELRENEKLFYSMEKEASEQLKSKIVLYTSNIKDKNKIYEKLDYRDLEDLIAKAEEISVEVFEPGQQ